MGIHPHLGRRACVIACASTTPRPPRLRYRLVPSGASADAPALSLLLHRYPGGDAEVPEMATELDRVFDQADADFPADWWDLPIPDGFDYRVLQRGRRMPGVEMIVSEMETRVEDGRMALARDPQRIAEAVQMLGGTLRQKMIAEKRLLKAGEYAMPDLLAVVVDG